jgi:hypothetical protein
MAAQQIVRTGPCDGPDQGPQDRTPDPGSPPCPPAGTATVAEPASRGRVRSWPLVLLALPASVAVWSGWVGIGQLTGFGEVRPLPGIWNSLHLDSAITLPIGVEAYAAYALHAWLSAGVSLTGRTHQFAKWSAIGSLLVGMAGQVAYHLLTQAGATRAPWEVTTAVACLPVLILGMAAALTHLIHADASTSPAAGPPSQDQASGGPDCQLEFVSPDRMAEAEQAALEVVASGHRVSRRNLRAAGLHGSNADLGKLARKLSPLSAGGGQAARSAS